MSHGLLDFSVELLQRQALPQNMDGDGDRVVETGFGTTVADDPLPSDSRVAMLLRVEMVMTRPWSAVAEAFGSLCTQPVL